MTFFFCLELEKTKDKIVKSIWKVRRGSRKNNKAVNGIIGEEQQSDASAPSLTNGHAIKEKPTAVVAAADEVARRLSFNERNIDEEIETRRKKSNENCELAASSSSSNVDTPTTINEFCHVAEEMRRRREEHIYTARRIFIAGTDAAAQVGFLQGTPTNTSLMSSTSSGVSSSATSTITDSTTAAKMDVLAQHSRHLNVNSESLGDVLSPETREKIRRFQLDSQTLRYKSQRQTEELLKVENERLKIEQQCEKAKQELENDDFLDALADNPRVLYAGKAPTSAAFDNNNVAADATSITSDYSTTSSNFAGSDQQQAPTSMAVAATPNRIMSQSFNGTLPPYSDYSSNASPITPHNTNLRRDAGENISNHSLTIDVSTIGAATTPATTVEASPPSPQQLYARTRLKHLDPEKSFLAKTFQPSTDTTITPSSSIGSIAAAVVDTRRKSPPTKVTRSKTSSILLGRRAKAWYETEDDDDAQQQQQQNGGVDASFVVRIKQNVDFDQNENNVRKISNSNSQRKSSPSTRIVSIDEQTTSSTLNGRSSSNEPSARSEPRTTMTSSRIGQKIKFRSKSSSADKRKDSRRHTLGTFADMDAIKTAIFGTSTKQQPTKTEQTTMPPPTTATNGKTHVGAGIVVQNSSNHKQSRTDKFKAWFKESFRKSSPDLIEDENLDENR